MTQPPTPFPLAQLRLTDETLWRTVFTADEQTMAQALSAALLGDANLARRIIETHGAWRLMNIPTLPAPGPRVEVVVYRDSDSATEAWIFVDGEETEHPSIEIIDNGYSDLSDEDTLTEWAQGHNEAAEGFTPAAAERIRALVQSEIDSH